MTKQQHSKLASVAAQMGIGPALAIYLPSIAEVGAQKTNMSTDEFIDELLYNKHMQSTFAEVMTELAQA